MTPSTMLPIGTQAPPFHLADVDGKSYSLESFSKNPLLLVMFLCNHCPYVKHIQSGILALARDYGNRGLAMVAINSNDVEHYPADSPEKMREEKQKLGYNFPYLFDATQKVAKSYQAACTPDFFLFDSNRELIYRGQFDDSRPNNREPVSGKDIRQAIDLALQNGMIPEKEQVPSMGCNIKWKRGEEPDYFRRNH